jgi:hypothetical protein
MTYFNKLKLIKILKNSVPTAQKTQHISITKRKLFMLFKEKITVYSDKHTKDKYSHCRKCSYSLFKQMVHVVIGLKVLPDSSALVMPENFIEVKAYKPSKNI